MYECDCMCDCQCDLMFYEMVFFSFSDAVDEILGHPYLCLTKNYSNE